jgi:hypothetical protein
MLVAIGQPDEAEATIRELKPPFLPGAQLLIAVSRDRWPLVVDLADSISRQPRTPALVQLLGTTGRASALAAMGRMTEAARVLRQARDSSIGAAARWYDRAELLLSVANGGQPSVATLSAAADSSAAQLLAIALRAAVAGDTTMAKQLLQRIETAPGHERALLGHGPALARGWIAARGGRWAEVTGSLSAASLSGEHDATLLDRVSSVELRWLVANGYAAQGKPDSAALHMNNAIAADHVPAGHLVLRGLVLRPARAKLSSWLANARRAGGSPSSGGT